MMRNADSNHSQIPSEQKCYPCDASSQPNSAKKGFGLPNGERSSTGAEFGSTIIGPDTIWQQEGTGALGVHHPVNLVYNDATSGLEFRRTISVDDKYLFYITDHVSNKSASPVTLYAYAQISRYGAPQISGYSVIHEGLFGVLGEDGLQEVTYKLIEDKNTMSFNVSNAWLGITDKYWAAALIPYKTAAVSAEFAFSNVGGVKIYQTGYHTGAETIAPGATSTTATRLFAGAKEVEVLDAYQKSEDINRFDRLIDWGVGSFITKRMFLAIDFIFHLVGNFGVGILIITALVKLLLFPLAKNSYEQVVKTKAL
jgi:YidC/Oxa1 family membrane protein insertase